MRLTAGKLRAAGWLVVLLGVMALASVLFATLLKPGGLGPAARAADAPWFKAYLVASTAIAVYLLVVFRMLLNEWFGCAKLDKGISLLIVCYIVYAAMKLVLNPAHLVLWPQLVQLGLGLGMMILAYYLGFAVLKGPAELFGYQRKLALGSLTASTSFSIMVLVSIAIMVIGLFTRSSPGMWAGVIYVLLAACMIVGLLAAIFSGVVMVRMFFAAARAVEAGHEPEALATV
ncbi:MAG: hypothetical protein KQH53_12505 [Desulfarculaceae bacterium]|nr:hypothetical protein [Desulfarculaceae bacterium]